MINILIITLIVILIIASYYLIPDKELLNSIFSYDLKNSLYSNKKFPKTNKLTFIPHPLTNWSLNPYYLMRSKL